MNLSHKEVKMRVHTYIVTDVYIVSKAEEKLKYILVS